MPTGQTAVHVVPLDATDTSHPPAVAPGVHLHGHEPMDRPDAAGPTVFTRSLTPLVPAQGDTGTGTGTLELGTPTETLPGQDTFTVTVADLDLGVTQNIWGDVRLTRNAALLPGVTTNHAFVYAVPPARMPTPAIPHVSTAEPFDVAAVPFRPGGAPGADAAVAGERQTLGTWLRNLVDSLLNRSAVLPGDTLDTLAQRYDLDLPALAASIADVAGLLAGGTALTVPGGAVIEVQSGDTLASIAAAASVSPADLAIAGRSVAGLLVPGTLVRPVALARTLRLSVDYGFVLATDGAATADQRQQLVSRLPVLLQPAFLFDSAVDLAPSSGFCAELAGRLTQWAADRRLDPDRGLWLFDVSLYTTLPDAGAGGADLPRQVPPLLELRSVQLDRRLVLPDPPAPSPAAAVPTTG
jgi:hypothetical protein